MKAYIESIIIEDDDGSKIATIEHDADFMYKVKLVEEEVILPDDLRFIAKILEHEMLQEEIK